ncbi:MAG: C10 family peptidase [Phycisphaerae bacterium]|nr:C10 family peptidase [Phycisphaerae bacterium]
MRTEKKAIRATGLMLVAVLALAVRVGAETANMGEARQVAKNFARAVVERDGSWGGSLEPRVADVETFKRGDRVIGYFCRIKPQGYVICCLYKELPPIKAYSATSDLDPTLDGGLVDVIKNRMERMLQVVESRSKKRPEAATPANWLDVVRTDYRPAWMAATDKAGFHFEPRKLRANGSQKGMYYRQGEFLVTSQWNQRPPYNDQCPDLGCDWSGYPYYGYNTNARVGCVAIAGVQILRYWNWPPCNSDGDYVDAYRWTTMPDWVDINSSPVPIACVAAACRSVGNSVSMDYGCSGSAAVTEDLEQVFENRRYYGDCNVKWRSEYSGTQWWDMLMGQFTVNRPVVYRIPGHAFVADGWDVQMTGGVSTAMVHMNYGWTASDNTWYAWDVWPDGDASEEAMIRTILPDVFLGETLSGTFSKPGSPGVHFDKPTRYFDRDTGGANATFAAGHSFQYLKPGLWVQCTGVSGGTDAIAFNGAPGDISEFYHGAPAGVVHIRITDGAMKIRGGGEMVLY